MYTFCKHQAGDEVMFPSSLVISNNSITTGQPTLVVIPCFPLEMSTYWQSLGWVMVLRSWKRPKILMEFGVRGRPLLPQTSCGRAEAKKVKAPSWASLRGFILSVAWILIKKYLQYNIWITSDWLWMRGTLRSLTRCSILSSKHHIFTFNVSRGSDQNW